MTTCAANQRTSCPTNSQGCYTRLTQKELSRSSSSGNVGNAGGDFFLDSLLDQMASPQVPAVPAALIAPQSFTCNSNSMISSSNDSSEVGQFDQQLSTLQQVLSELTSSSNDVENENDNEKPLDLLDNDGVDFRDIFDEVPPISFPAPTAENVSSSSIVDPFFALKQVSAFTSSASLPASRQYDSLVLFDTPEESQDSSFTRRFKVPPPSLLSPMADMVSSSTSSFSQSNPFFLIQHQQEQQEGNKKRSFESTQIEPINSQKKHRCSSPSIVSSSSSSASTSDDVGQRFREYQSEQWNENFQLLHDYVHKSGDVRKPTSYDYTSFGPNHKKLSRWLKRQRYQYKLFQDGKLSTMTPDRIKALEALPGFAWNSHYAIWEERLNELIEFKSQHGHCNVPSLYPTNQKLATWVKCQRRQYKLYKINNPRSNMTIERLDRLNAIGFHWELRCRGSANTM